MAQMSAGRFPTTSWSCIARANRTPEPESRIAVTQLCQTYWYPLYAFARRRGANVADAEDWVQSFFTHVLESNTLAYPRPERGRFRNFLLAAFRQYAAKMHEHSAAAKRSPAMPLVQLDAVEGELRFANEIIDAATPDQAFEHDWALSLLKRVSDRLRMEQAEEGKLDRFEALHGSLTGQSTLSAREIGEQLGLSEGAVRMAVHRLKERYGVLLREEVAATLDESESVDDEIRSLMVALQFRGTA